MFAPSIARRLIEQFAAIGSTTAATPALEELTARELDVLRLIARGLSNAEIATELVVTRWSRSSPRPCGGAIG